jgi:hypothetical protein
MTRLKRRTANVKRAEGTRAGVARRGRATAAPRLRHSSDEAARRDRAKQGHARSRGCALVGGHTGQGAGELTRGVPGEGGRVTEVGAPGRGGVPSGGVRGPRAAPPPPPRGRGRPGDYEEDALVSGRRREGVPREDRRVQGRARRGQAAAGEGHRAGGRATRGIAAAPRGWCG